MYRPAELILKEVKNVDGVDINIKLEGLGGSRRRISGGLFIEAPPRAIWDVLTNYNNLHEYIPNIAESGAILQPNGRVRIEQVGVISPTLRITTRIVLEVTEEPFQRLKFSKVESREFIEFEGIYSITSCKDGRAYLEYSVEALPLPILPIQLVQGKIKKEVPPMLAAVRTNANKYHSLRCKTLGPNWMDDVPVPTSTSYRKRLSSTNSIADDRPKYTAPGIESTKLYTIERAPSLPFTSLASGLLQAVLGMVKLLPG
ncbi:hypothetical protein GUITHDRAFT_137515 [Guillardia theta CCMP2712]|uniref:Coenzyme Q-binding protein COQ10 START domain-containing protein n=1 Tax=Guillardia theta (strain CCMP2712) TaxID=905079 RepID=L1JG99_GUITC|nr:hypothetical protein GUITHDRAFT_137515 [Guillardia theta CCMP2712]EKX47332.1 hypothetical protein GUITHDRAFT_137515 [Guillardia theta CCMP2712]|eukprot:XP_005834312.1 hypothetical protein GUITHDRAFT_137515 [Guillardia theta CCMP2712]